MLSKRSQHIYQMLDTFFVFFMIFYTDVHICSTNQSVSGQKMNHCVITFDLFTIRQTWSDHFNSLSCTTGVRQTAGGVRGLQLKRLWVLLFVAETHPSSSTWGPARSSAFTVLSLPFQPRPSAAAAPLLPHQLCGTSPRLLSPAVRLRSCRQGPPCCCVRVDASLVVGSRG